MRDDHLSCLPLAAKDDDSGPGEPVLIPAVGESEALAGVPGKIVDFGPERIEFDNRINPTSLGAPVIRVKNGVALGLVTAAKKIDLSEMIAQAWPGNPAPGAARIIPYYAVPLRDVAGWEPLDLAHFADETAFLQNFHDTTRCLDSYLNGRRPRPMNPRFSESPPDNQYYTKNARIQAASDTYRKFATGADRNQTLDAARELLFDLLTVAQSNVDRLQSSSTLTYAFDRQRAQEELAYRKAIKAELDALGDNIPRLDTIARSR